MKRGLSSILFKADTCSQARDARACAKRVVLTLPKSGKCDLNPAFGEAATTEKDPGTGFMGAVYPLPAVDLLFYVMASAKWAKYGLGY